jgi:hypothetical protein
MNCTDVQTDLDDYIDGDLPFNEKKAVELHLSNCVSCQQSFDEFKAIRQALNTLPVEQASADFESRVFSEVRSQYAERSRGTRRFGNRFTAGFVTAVAASVVLWFTSTVFLPVLDDQQPQIINVAMNQTHKVRLMFDAPADLDQVTLSLELPDNIELEGYTGQRQLVWQTSLKQGENILALPVTAIGSGQGELVAKLSYGDRLKQFRILLRTTDDGAFNDQINHLKPV